MKCSLRGNKNYYPPIKTRRPSVLRTLAFNLRPSYLIDCCHLDLAQPEVILRGALCLDHGRQPRVLPGHQLGLLLQRLDLGDQGLEEGEGLEEERLAARLGYVLHQLVQLTLCVADFLILNIKMTDESFDAMTVILAE